MSFNLFSGYPLKVYQEKIKSGNYDQLDLTKYLQLLLDEAKLCADYVNYTTVAGTFFYYYNELLDIFLELKK